MEKSNEIPETNNWLPEILRRHVHLTTLALYLGIVIVLFFPVVINLGGTLLTNTLGVSQDKWHFIWNFWWFKQAIITGQNPYFTTSFYYPTGAPLALQTLDFMDALISLPVAIPFGEIAAFNFVALLSITLSGFFAYLLAWHLTRSWLGSFTAGVIFALFPQHIAQLYAGHPNLASIEWLPAYLLCLMLTFETGRLRYAILGGVALAAITYTELELVFMMAVTSLVYLAYLALARRSFFSLRTMLLTGVLLGVWGAIVSPYLYEAILLVLSGGRTPPPLLSVVVNSASPDYYFIPSPYNYVFSSFVRPVYTSSILLGGAAQWVIFVGWTALALAIIGILLYGDRRKYFFGGLALVALYFSLGPSSSTGANIQSPLTFLYSSVSFLDFFRTPARMSTVVMLAVSCLAAMGVKVIASKRFVLGARQGTPPVSSTGPTARTGRITISGKAVAILCIGLVLFEFAPVVQTTNPTYYPAYFTIPSNSNQFAVLNIPARVYPNQYYLYQSTLIQTPVVNGKLSQLIQTLPNYTYVEPFLRILAAPLTSRLFPDPINQSLSQAQLAPSVMSLFRIKYVVLYRYEFNTLTNFTANVGAHTAWGLINSTLYSALGSPVYQDDNTLVFALQQLMTSSQIASSATAGPIVLPGAGWGAPGVGGRNITTPARLIVYSSTSQTYNLVVSYSSPFPGTATPTLCVQNENVSMVESCGYVRQSGTSTAYALELIQGLNVISFNSTPDATISVHNLVFTP